MTKKKLENHYEHWFNSLTKQQQYEFHLMMIKRVFDFNIKMLKICRKRPERF